MLDSTAAVAAERQGKNARQQLESVALETGCELKACRDPGVYAGLQGSQTNFVVCLCRLRCKKKPGPTKFSRRTI
jgi:hypothetical protein